MPSQSSLTLESTEPVLLSPSEGLLWRVEQGVAGAFNVTVLFQLDGIIEAKSLAVALERLQRRHPKLRTVIVDGSDGRLRYEFEHVVPPIPFEITDYEGESPWREETRRLLQAGFPVTGPLAAISVLRSGSRGCCDLLLTVHHAIADGLSAIVLVDDLLTEYANAEAQLEESLGAPLPIISAPRAKSSGGWRGRLGLFRRFVRIQREERRERQTPLPETSGIPPQSQWVHWIFSREDTLRLVQRCRKEQASLSGALVAAVCCGLMDCLPVSNAVFKCQFPLNIRESLDGADGPVTLRDLGCFVSIMNEFYEVSQQPVFWDLARSAHQDVQAFVKQGGPAFYYNLLERVVAIGRLFPRGTRKALPSNSKRVTLLATNYGVLNIRDSYGSLRPRGCTLTFKNDVIGPPLVMEALVLGQRLNIGFVADGIQPAFWEQLQIAVRKHLDAAARASH